MRKPKKPITENVFNILYNKMTIRDIMCKFSWNKIKLNVLKCHNNGGINIYPALMRNEIFYQKKNGKINNMSYYEHKLFAHNAHVSLCYNFFMPNYATLHVTSFKIKMLMASIANTDVWGILERAPRSNVCMVKPSSELFGLAVILQDLIMGLANRADMETRLHVSVANPANM